MLRVQQPGPAVAFSSALLSWSDQIPPVGGGVPFQCANRTFSCCTTSTPKPPDCSILHTRHSDWKPSGPKSVPICVRLLTRARASERSASHCTFLPCILLAISDSHLIQGPRRRFCQETCQMETGGLCLIRASLEGLQQYCFVQDSTAPSSNCLVFWTLYPGGWVGGWVKGLFQWFLRGMDPPPPRVVTPPQGGGGIFLGAGFASLGTQGQ